MENSWICLAEKSEIPRAKTLPLFDEVGDIASFGIVLAEEMAISESHLTKRIGAVEFLHLPLCRATVPLPIFGAWS